MRKDGKNAVPANLDQTPRLTPESLKAKVIKMAQFNDSFVALVNSGKATVSAESAKVSKESSPNGQELPYSFSKVAVKDYEGALAYFNDPILDKDGKPTGEFGYVSSDGKTKMTPDELLWDAVSKFITNKEKASARQKAVNDSVPEDQKAIISAAKKMVKAGKFGGNLEKAIKVLTAAANAE